MIRRIYNPATRSLSAGLAQYARPPPGYHDRGVTYPLPPLARPSQASAPGLGAPQPQLDIQIPIYIFTLISIYIYTSIYLGYRYANTPTHVSRVHTSNTSTPVSIHVLIQIHYTYRYRRTFAQLQIYRCLYIDTYTYAVYIPISPYIHPPKHRLSDRHSQPAPTRSRPGPIRQTPPGITTGGGPTPLPPLARPSQASAPGLGARQPRPDIQIPIYIYTLTYIYIYIRLYT
jgi:hypothetical protein